MNNKIERDQVEQMLWRWSGWKAEQRAVDAVMTVIDGYAASQAPVEKTMTKADELRALTRYPVPLEGFKDSEGALWARITVPQPKTRADAPKLEERERTCTRCGRNLVIARFNRDKKSKNGRKAQCKQCEAERRIERLSGDTKVVSV